MVGDLGPFVLAQEPRRRRRVGSDRRVLPRVRPQTRRPGGVGRRRPARVGDLVVGALVQRRPPPQPLRRRPARRVRSSVLRCPPDRPDQTRPPRPRLEANNPSLHQTQGGSSPPRSLSGRPSPRSRRPAPERLGDRRVAGIYSLLALTQIRTDGSPRDARPTDWDRRRDRSPPRRAQQSDEGGRRQTDAVQARAHRVDRAGRRHQRRQRQDRLECPRPRRLLQPRPHPNRHAAPHPPVDDPDPTRLQR
jgi:hypothetical protein